MESINLNPFSVDILEVLHNKTPDEILFTMKDKSVDFKYLLSSGQLNQSSTCLALKLIAKACTSSQTEYLKDFLEMIMQMNNFVFVTLQNFLSQLKTMDTIKNNRFVAVCDVTSMLETMQMLHPDTSLPTTMKLIPQLKEAASFAVENDDSLGDELIKRISELDERKKSVELEFSLLPASQQTDKEEPKNFRQIPIFPDHQDIEETDVYLRPNKIEGRYSNVDHYLDVHFRLLREDFIRPLREGIIEYLYKKQQGQRIKNQDIWVYYDVKFVNFVVMDNRVVRNISFDVRGLGKVDWLKSKRLIDGSLLCLSSNNFQTIIFGTVDKRNVHELRRGIVGIRLENQAFDIRDVYVMIESVAYFEAYRHVLTVLQGTITLPLQEHIIEAEKVVKPPAYMNEGTTYFITPESLKREAAYSIYKRRENVPKVTVLDDSSWPSANQLVLNESQLRALKCGLTKRLAIIQGPPGTGKTYVGLKIVEILIANSPQCTIYSSPILIVCYTNHALDQFLEGVLKFSQNIVRVGGRSSSETLKNYNISNMIHRKDGMKSRVWSSDYHLKRMEFNEIVRKISWKNSEIESAYRHVLPYHKLQEEINHVQYQSLFREAPKEVKMNAILSQWLQAALSSGSNNESTDVKQKMNPKMKMKTVGNGTKKGGSLECKAEHPANLRQASYSKSIKNYLNEATAMTAEEINQTRQLWDLSPRDRLRMYKTWIDAYLEKKNQELTQLLQTYEFRLKRFERAREDYRISALKMADVIGMTTTGAAKNRGLINGLRPKIVIVEEAAEVLEAHIITSLSENTQHLILIGDHQQLKPNPTVYDLAKGYNLDVSLFERLIINGVEYCQLQIQHRMRPCISKLLVPHIYKDLEDHPSVKDYDDVEGFCKSMYFVNHHEQEFRPSESKSRINDHEASFLLALCNYILQQGYPPEKVTILTTYLGQMQNIKNLLKPGTDLLNSVRISVVDNYQGEENDIILLSLVRSNEEGNIGFLKTHNRVCVALSRAKKGLFCIGNFDLLKKSSDLWDNIVGTLTLEEAIGPELSLKCKMHGKITKVSSSHDFCLVPEGGCSDPCNYNLPCGHICERFCHPNDQSHQRCLKPCERLCPNDHKCPQPCYKNCKPCLFEMIKVLPECQHEIMAKCFLEPEEIVCHLPCAKTLPCGHNCKGLCGKSCGKCMVLVSKSLPNCTHKVRVKCHRSAEDVKCPFLCEKEQPCGHKCAKKCGEIPCGDCQKFVPKILKCKHEVNAKCQLSDSDIICPLPCARLLPCGHQCKGFCRNPCSSSCSQAVSFKGNCGHVMNLPCHQVKNPKGIASRCKARCSKRLSCGHPCLNLCSETCETNCKKTINVKIPCGHVMSLKCNERNADWVLQKCRASCQAVRRCKHRCLGTCGKCFQGRFHVPCQDPRCEDTRYNNWMTILQVGPCCERLKCGHFCIGLRGDPCPRLCRTCNKTTVTKLHFGTEDLPKAVFIQVTECSHLLEVLGVIKWLMSLRAGQVMRCPWCNVVISNKRLSTMRNWIQEVTLERNNCLQENDTNQLKKNSIIEKIDEEDTQLKLVPLYLARMSSSLTLLKYLLEVDCFLTERVLVMYEVCTSSLLKLNRVCKRAHELLTTWMRYSALDCFRKELERYLLALTYQVMVSVQETFQRENLMDFQDIDIEVQRLEDLFEFITEVDITEVFGNADSLNIFNRAVDLLLQPRRYDQMIGRTIIKLKHDLRKSRGLSLDESTEESELTDLKSVKLIGYDCIGKEPRFLENKPSRLYPLLQEKVCEEGSGTLNGHLGEEDFPQKDTNQNGITTGARPKNLSRQRSRGKNNKNGQVGGQRKSGDSKLPQKPQESVCEEGSGTLNGHLGDEGFPQNDTNQNGITTGARPKNQSSQKNKGKNSKKGQVGGQQKSGDSKSPQKVQNRQRTLVNGSPQATEKGTKLVNIVAYCNRQKRYLLQNRKTMSTATLNEP